MSLLQIVLVIRRVVNLECGIQRLHTQKTIETINFGLSLAQLLQFISLPILTMMARAFTSEFDLLALTQPEWKGVAVHYREIINFLNRSKINYAISADPVVSRPYLEQFWETADHDCTVNPNVIRATVAGHDIAISEDTIRRVL
ncbi:hypothetical protein L1987_06654 [Smallanthus sonchifolius]|uniref:Uncharacterized protein n=1 Tax=Smallanthus sonchifolius TaxID=185202 RepID=A0ACB9JYR2_9ASTR|nr:hypothetical protein L1987_06654 [Smallanthus sonchifolius]